MQVELAKLKYLLPRLVGAGVALSRLGGGIGTREPGETKLETDRRRITELYRSGQVLAHVTRRGRVSIEADVAPRSLPHLHRHLMGNVDRRIGAE